MKKSILKNLSLLVVIFVLAVSFSGCSKKTFSHKYQAKSRASSSAIDPVTHKDEPVRKNYIVPNKSKKILGLQKPHL